VSLFKTFFSLTDAADAEGCTVESCKVFSASLIFARKAGGLLG
jgi:hypothetical protein